MLVSKILNISCVLKNNAIPHSAHIKFLSTSSILLNIVKKEDNKIAVQSERKLKEWREPLLVNNRGTDEIVDIDSGFFGAFRVKFPLTPWGIKEFLAIKALDRRRIRQKLNESNAIMLGNDLSSAYFLIFEGGKVKFQGDNEWLSMNTEKLLDILPQYFDPNYVVEEIDASGILLFYEALENFENVTNIKKVIFQNSPMFNDWFIDKISTMFPRLEYLDVSNCPKLTERGLEGLYRAINLKKLIITNYRKSATFELTCLMLEDCLPNLEIEILDPPSKNSIVNKS